jgi:hypothetical protein
MKLNMRLFNRILRRVRPYLFINSNWLSNLDKFKNSKVPSSNLKIIIATSTGSNWPCSSFESLLGVALSLRGANVKFLLCDGVLPACQECDYQWLSESSFVNSGPKSLCSTCFNPSYSMIKKTGLPVLRYSDYLIDKLKYDDLIGCSNHAKAGALRYYGRGNLPSNDKAYKILNRYQSAAKITEEVIKQLILEEKPDIAVFHHGIYVPQGIIGKKFREAGVKVVNWTPAYRKGTVLFSHNSSYHFTMIDESSSEWSDMKWTDIMEKNLIDYLHSRRTGKNDWINFQINPIFNNKSIIKLLDLDLNIPVIGLLTNVMWDAQLHFEKSAFPNMLDWLIFTIKHFMNRDDVQLVIRIHPAEVYGTVPSRQLVADEINTHFGELPKHIKIVGPDISISTYALMEMCDSVLVYGTKTALELACFGIPVVVSGDAWCRGKGFTIDASSTEDYNKILSSLPLKIKLSDQDVQKARKYAYHFFFRRMIPITFLKPLNYLSLYSININSIKDLMPGMDPGLDIICNGIITGKSFIFDK